MTKSSDIKKLKPTNWSKKYPKKEQLPIKNKWSPTKKKKTLKFNQNVHKIHPVLIKKKKKQKKLQIFNILMNNFLKKD